MQEQLKHELANKIQAILFTEAGPVKKQELQKIFSLNHADLQKVLKYLQERLSDSALVVVQTDNEVALRVSREFSKFLSDYYQEKRQAPLGEASYETLAIVMYLGKANKTEIDYIRGINSQAALKNLLIKGYLQKQKQGSKTLYTPTTKAMEFLGITSFQQMPEYTKVRTSLLELLGRAYEDAK